MAKARFDIPTQLPDAVSRPIYAGVGATDRVVAVVRSAVADVQKRVVEGILDSVERLSIPGHAIDHRRRCCGRS